MTDEAAKNPPNPPPPQPSGGGGGKPSASAGKARTFQSPKGTRDFYPQDLLRRRYIIDTWRRVSLRHGFEEIDGPTFEDSELYTVKSGEGILGELFGAYSGKDPNDTKQVQSGGPPPFALRAEFTPTLARMYAARAKQLPQPTKWFCVSNFFRAERPQRGRLREFWQWNADVIGDADPNPQMHDVEMLATLADCLTTLGLPSASVRTHVGNREIVADALQYSGVANENTSAAIQLLDKRQKTPAEKFALLASEIGLDVAVFDRGIHLASRLLAEALKRKSGEEIFVGERTQFGEMRIDPVMQSGLQEAIEQMFLGEWVHIDLGIARGLAYYTGTVFELIAEGERAVAGGGRYDKLIELFGGPPTPAVGFGMGDVVLTNLLDDRKLMPEGRELLEATSRPLPVRPDVFVIANEAAESQQKVVPLVAMLRRGVESDKYKQGECKPWADERYTVPPLHARRTYKATKNIGKLLADATACHARFALIIENAETGTLKNLDSGEQTKDVPLDKVGGIVARG